MNRREVFNDLEDINRTTSINEIKNVLSRIYNGLSLKQIKTALRLRDLQSNAKYEMFIDVRTKESQLADLEYCISKCAENLITEAVFGLDNFIAPFSYMLDEPISDFERECAKFMINHIMVKIEELQ